MSLPATDNFNRADGALGANWTSQGAPPTIVSNFAVPDGGVFGYAYWSADAFANDQYSQALLGDGNTGTTVYAGVTVRGSGTGASRNNYFLNNEGTDAKIYKSVAGAVTTLQTIAGGGSINGGVLYRLTVEGTTLKAYRSTDTSPANLAQIGTDQADSDLASGSAGIGGFNAGVAKIDDWEGGNMGGAGGRIFKLAGEGGGLAGPSRGLVARGAQQQWSRRQSGLYEPQGITHVSR